uniref:Uncharacterized protein n=1 Tax=Parastrongyloides trichosuri TaxID=131310 RepID=A0A0N4ZBE5_PARTI
MQNIAILNLILKPNKWQKIPNPLVYQYLAEHRKSECGRNNIPFFGISFLAEDRKILVVVMVCDYIHVEANTSSSCTSGCSR